jgi:hypothetical protein
MIIEYLLPSGLKWLEKPKSVRLSELEDRRPAASCRINLRRMAGRGQGEPRAPDATG